MKIIHVNCSESGSTGKIIEEISKESFDRGYESVLLAPKISHVDTKYLRKHQTSKIFEQGLYRRIGRLLGRQYDFAPLSTCKIIKTIKKEAPDVVHVHCINGYMVNVFRLLTFLKKRNINTIVTNHAEFFYTGNCAHAFECDKWLTGCGNCSTLKSATGSKFFDRTAKSWKKMEKAFNGFNNLYIASVSSWVMDRAKKSPILREKRHLLIENGINSQVFNKTMEFTERDKKQVLHVTSLFATSDDGHKGGKFLLELSKRFENENVEFVVAGLNFVKEQLPKNIKLLGRVSDQEELSKLYQNSDVTVLTSKRETFGMAVAESLSCGTPVVGFKSGGSESVAIAKYSSFVEFGDVSSLEKELRKFLNVKNEGVASNISTAALKKYDSKLMAKKYNDAYEGLILENASEK